MKKKILSFALALLMTLGVSVPALAADYSGTASANVEMTEDSALTGPYTIGSEVTFTVGAGCELNGNKKTLTVANGATLVVKGTLKDIEVVVLKGATLNFYSGCTIDGLTLDADDGSTVQFYNNEAESPVLTSSFIGTPKADGIGLKHVDNGLFSGKVEDKDVTIVLTSNGVLPTGASLELSRDEKEFIKGTNEGGVFTYKFEADLTKTYNIYLNVGGERIKTVNSIMLYDEDSAAKVTRNSTKAEFVVGEAIKLFDVVCPDYFTVTAKVESKYNTKLSITKDGIVTALEELDESDVDFTFYITAPGDSEPAEAKRGETTPVMREFTVKNLAVKSPVDAPSSESLYVNQRTKIFDITIPEGYSLTEVEADNDDVIFRIDDPQNITVKSTMSRKDVEFSFTFKNDTAKNEFTVKHTVRLSASVYRPVYPITVTLPKLYIAVGEAIQTSIPYYETLSITASSAPNVAYITGTGRVVGRSPGTATLYIYTVGGGRGSVQVIVTGATTSVSGSTSLTVGSTTQLSVYGDSINYCNSSNESILRVTSSGLVTAVGTGTATVYVSTAYGRGGAITITVSPKPLVVNIPSSMKVGETGYVSLAEGYLFSVRSSDSKVVQAYDSGYLVARGAGTATLTIKNTVGRTVTKTIRVTGTDSPDPGTSAFTMNVGDTKQLMLSGTPITGAYSLDTDVAKVTANGKVTAVGKGTTTIYLFNRFGTAGTVTVSVTGSDSGIGGSGSTDVRERSMKVDQSMSLRITGKTIVGASLEEDNGTVSVTNKGKVTGLNAGTDTVYIITSDNAVYRYEFTIKSRSGVVDVPKNNSLALRKSASSSSSRLAKLRDGQKLTIIGRSGNYYKVNVTISGKTYTGYASKNYIDK